MTAPISILEAALSPELFGQQFAGPAWERWRAFLAALFALPLSGAALDLYRYHTGRQAAPHRAFREAALIVGRRGGKSRALALVAVYVAALCDHSAHVAPGERPVIAVIAKDRQQAGVILNYVKGLLHSVPALEALIIDELTETIRLANGIEIQIFTGSVGAPRGRSFIAILCDEIAYWITSDTGANPDKEIIRAVRPGLATIPTSILLLASTPYAKRGVLYDAYQRHYGKDDARVLVWKATTLEMHPDLDSGFIDEAREEDPDSARSEYDAEFLDGISDAFDREVIESCIARGVYEMPVPPGIDCVGFIDVSAGSGANSTVSTVAHLEPGGAVIIDAIRETRPPFLPQAMAAEHAAFFRSYGISRIVGDKYAGSWPVAEFAEHGIRYEQAARPKSDLYHELLPMLNGRRVQLLDNVRLVHQLAGLERRASRTGRVQICEPPGGHDDVANSVAGAVSLIGAAAEPSLVRRADLTAAGAAPDEHLVVAIVAALWITIAGDAAVVFGGIRRPARDTESGNLVVLDVIYWPQMRVSHLADIARRLDDLAEAAYHRHGGNQGIGVQLYSPAEWADAAAEALGYAFAPRASRRDALHRTVGAYPYPPVLLADPVRLLHVASIAATSGRISFAADALAQADTLPLFGALQWRPGLRERVEDDALRMAALALAGVNFARDQGAGLPTATTPRAA